MLIISVIVCCCFKTTFAEQDPQGHLKPLGSHRDSEGGIEVLESFPYPDTFYKTYVKPGKPFLVKQGALKIPAFKLWTDDYLSKKYGHLEVDIEVGKKETRSGDNKVVSLKKFLEVYKKKDIYMVNDMAEEMRGEYAVPRSLLCGGFTNHFTHFIMWFSSGGTKSVLHHDALDNINCLMEGNKDLILMDKAHSDLVQKDGWKLNGGFSSVDVEKVDMYKFPGLRNIPWYTAHMEKGDCLFIPIRWYHNVNSYTKTKRNFAVNLWFTHLPHFNKTDCDMKKDIPAFEPLSNFNVPKSDESEDEENQLEPFRSDILQAFSDYDELTEANLKEALSQHNFAHVKTEHIAEFFTVVDKDKNNILTWEELYSFNMSDMLTKAPSFNPDDGEEEESNDVPGEDVHTPEDFDPDNFKVKDASKELPDVSTKDEL